MSAADSRCRANTRSKYLRKLSGKRRDLPNPTTSTNRQPAPCYLRRFTIDVGVAYSPLAPQHRPADFIVILLLLALNCILLS
ncbi:hypothetical protein N431DRAFT_7278 [Stipitochalara longipes BDJ]|nr:hypothetical protein N431DRAFT_7278 [Stipitochalara longipes BDJ]